MTLNDLFEKCLVVSRDYLKQKERKNYYEVEIYSCFNCGEVCYYVDIDDEDVATLNEMKKKYGDEYIKHLDETFEPDYFISLDSDDELLGINTDRVHHLYLFEVRGFEGENVVSRTARVPLTDEEYARLLAWHLACDWVTINKLPDFDRVLSGTIHRNALAALTADDGCFEMAAIPFTLIMKEVLSDAEIIRKKSMPDE